eukprot:TRINITY_DN32377_c0_g1_i1.p1 TRINITY_DN32377_c0_g1~~TRINITY_DN32377_c0_g1_i1.p1  ORF type:complete len:631 (-),score=63.49 TRINITY_DN32377_c0_g1_i1:577-2469(-)
MEDMLAFGSPEAGEMLTMVNALNKASSEIRALGDEPTKLLPFLDDLVERYPHKDSNIYNTPLTRVDPDLHDAVLLCKQLHFSVFLNRAKARIAAGEAGAVEDLVVAANLASTLEEKVNVAFIHTDVLLREFRVKEAELACDALSSALEGVHNAPSSSSASPVSFSPRLKADAEALVGKVKLVASQLQTGSNRNAQGVSALKAGDLSAAIDHFSEAVRALKDCDPNLHATALANLSRAFLKDGRVHEAIASAKKCAEMRRDSTKAWLRYGEALEISGNHKEACNVYVDAIRRGTCDSAELMTALRAANSISQSYSPEQLESIVGGENYCALCRSKSNLLRCSKCKYVQYCGVDHQKRHWRTHKSLCPLMAEMTSDRRDVENLTAHSNLKPVQSTPPINVHAPFKSLVDVSSWVEAEKYLSFPQASRGCDRRLRNFASYPLTLAAALTQFKLHGKDSLAVHVIGANDDNEWAAFEQASEVIENLPFPNLSLTMIGPQLSQDKSYVRAHKSFSLSVKAVPGTWHEQVAERHVAEPDLIIAYNVNIHNDACRWRPTIEAVAKSKVPFACTGSTLRGLQAFMQALRVWGKFEVDALRFTGVAPFPSPSLEFGSADASTDIVRLIPNSQWAGCLAR